MRVALVKGGVIFGFGDVDDQGNLTPNQILPVGLTISSVSVDQEAAPQIGWVESQNGFYEGAVTYEEASAMCAEDSGLDIVKIIKGIQTAGSAYYKNKVCDAIDAKTDEIIARGFTFDGSVFSLSIEAQKNYIWFYILFSKGTLPDNTEVTTMGNLAYAISLSKAQAFFDTASYMIATILGSGRDLKVQVMSSNDIAALQAFVDPRQ